MEIGCFCRKARGNQHFTGNSENCPLCWPCCAKQPMGRAAIGRPYGEGGWRWRAKLAATGWCGRETADGSEPSLRRVRVGCVWRSMTAATAGASGASGTPPPYGGKAPVLSLRGPVRPVAIRFPRPLFNVFKWQFENSTIFNSQFSIFNSPRAGCVWRSLTAATAGANGASRRRPLRRRLPILYVGTARSRPAFSTNAICRRQI